MPPITNTAILQWQRMANLRHWIPEGQTEFFIIASPGSGECPLGSSLSHYEVWPVSVDVSDASTAFLLVSHGSKDPRHGAALERVGHFVREQLQIALAGEGNPPAVSPLTPAPLASNHSEDGRPVVPTPRPPVQHPIVGVAALEGGPMPLHEQIVGFGRRALAAGICRLRIVPIFLLCGVHVSQDIPAEVAQAAVALPDLALEVCDHLGSHPGLTPLLRHRVGTTGAEGWILLSHGSRRPGGNQAIQALAAGLGGMAAFWSVAPNLEQQVIQLMQQGVQQLTIMPYFLFAGGITDVITQATEELAERFPTVRFRLLPPLGATAEVANLVTELALQQRVASPTSVASTLHRPLRTCIAS